MQRLVVLSVLTVVTALGPRRRRVFTSLLARNRTTTDRHRSLVSFGLLPQNVLQNPVHNQVGVTADRRGEVRVGGGSQGEVPKTLLRIPCLLQRTQHQVRQD